MLKKKKSLGQNFLKSKAAIRSIVLAGNLKKGDVVLEVGPGKGALTRALLESGTKVVAVEKDDRLIPILSETFKKEIEEGSFTLIHGDILRFDAENYFKNSDYKLIANIPYYITGLLFRKFLETKHQPKRLVLLVQKEVAERIVARDGKESILSLSVKAYGTPKIIARVSKKMFSPIPKVDSAVLLVSDISKEFFLYFSQEKFFTWIRAGFAQKRKKVMRNLESVESIENLKNIFKKQGIPENARAEDISLNMWGEILRDSEPRIT